MLKRTSFLVAIGATLVLAVGCGQENLDETNIEDDIETELAGQGVANPQVVCPDDVAAEEGAEFECLVEPDGGEAVAPEGFEVAVTLTGDDGEFELSTSEDGDAGP